MSSTQPSMAWESLGYDRQSFVHDLAIGSNGALYALWYDHTSSSAGVDKLLGGIWTPLGNWERHHKMSTGIALCVDNQENVFVLLRENGPLVLYRWNGTAWSTVGNAAPSQLAVDGQGHLYGIGNLNKPQHETILKFSYADSAWTQIDSPTDHSCSPLQMVADSSSNIYAVFRTYFKPETERSLFIYKYEASGQKWTLLGSVSDIDPRDRSSFRLAVDRQGSTLYLAGSFTAINPPAGTAVPADGMAKWDGQTWQALGAGISGPVKAIACGTAGRLYAGKAGKTKVAEWDGSQWNTWTAYGYSGVQSIVVDDSGNVYAGGEFSFYHSGSFGGRNVAKCVTSVRHDTSASTQRARLSDAQTAPSIGLGYSVSISKDKKTIAALAPNFGTGNLGQSSLYVFSRSADDSWQQTHVSLGVAAKQCHSVAVDEDGSTVFVGAREYPRGGLPAVGAVYIYTRSQAQSLALDHTLENPETDDATAVKSSFGESVAVGNDTMVVGAPNLYLGVGIKTNQAGYAHVFTHQSTGWALPLKLTAPNPVPRDKFGQSVAISGDGKVIVVGAPGKNQAYVFTRGTAGVWGPGTPLGDDTTGNEFGDMVAISKDGSRIGVSARTKDQTYVFSRQNAQWVRHELPVEQSIRGDHMGHVVAISGDGNQVLVGDPYDIDHPQKNSDAVYVFENRGGADQWEQVRMLRGDDTEAGDQFGIGVAISEDGGMIVVGAPQWKATVGGQERATGALYIFE